MLSGLIFLFVFTLIGILLTGKKFIIMFDVGYFKLVVRRHADGCVVLDLLGQQVKAKDKMENKNLGLFINPTYIYGIPTLCKAFSEVRQIIKDN